ncbi:transient receptor potential cation channel subfamily A member 1-like isoform X1 [Biomphalaria glabrata]|uniref:Transient receptor potential cation channel subfamily A member 1-like isoform X1 n=1 Tax=Biomphalaria glabrata TaxID=6526 RepID=A0A9W3AIQ2_BIOGL|nr:transient receptor potential cation channel subfamily A member 1-like isoform X1 [Biomphalaria glabrata]XP_055887019.1 transient receptor potential cation channel subfamily A member 1-like isoform X1 [Biomphalaria glabrata]XP_055887020.1 transient receptor potential cation channel subfamily A member 1-like isoform X1 [Biomphalaria glabrata]XP_055887021.1 transient receptor potential cation channel subfamily A member 1-like isoform X1 [Biomphalaria glabrata]
MLQLENDAFKQNVSDSEYSKIDYKWSTKEREQFAMLFRDAVEGKPLKIIVDSHNLHPIHVAVLIKEPNIVKSILASNIGSLELNAVDKKKRTALHFAVAKEHLEIVDILLRAGAKTNILDSKLNMPIHIAVIMKDTKVLELLLEHEVNANAVGAGGYTPLHIAARHNNANAVYLLLNHGADFRRSLKNGSYPVHIASRSGAFEALVAIFEAGQLFGFDAESLLAMKNNDQQTTFHLAVYGGFEKVVKYLLDKGATVIDTMDDASTPIHYAASQGKLGILRMMYDSRPHEVEMGLKMVDAAGRTPLHLAARFNHFATVTYLLDLYDNIDVPDKMYKTPLLMAAANGAIETLVLLIRAGAFTTAKDIKKRNFVHYLVATNINLNKITQVLKNLTTIKLLVDDKDIFGFTPLHYAATQGNLSALRILLQLGADVFEKDRQMLTAFHLAIIAGEYPIFLTLMQSQKGNMLREECGKNGLTPIHLAAQFGQVNILKALMKRGSHCERDIDNNTPLHLASAAGQLSCITYLLSVHPDLIDCCNDAGDTALHIAARCGHAQVVLVLLSANAQFFYNQLGKCFYDDVTTYDKSAVARAFIEHERWQECLRFPSEVHGLLSFLLIAHFPRVFKTVLNKCVTHSELNPKSLNYCIIYNFRFLRVNKDYKKFTENSNLGYSPLLPLQTMLKYKRVELLLHPLTVSFLRMKWIRYGFLIKSVNLVLYFLFLTFMTSFVARNLHSYKHYHGLINGSLPYNSEEHFKKIFQRKLPSYGQEVNDTLVEKQAPFQWSSNWFPPEAHIEFHERYQLSFIFLFSTVQTLKVIIYLMKKLRERIFMDFNIAIELVLYICCLYFSLTFLLGYAIHTQWEAIAIAVLLTWLNGLFQLTSIDFFGVYILMFIEAVKIFFKVSLIFCMLITAFGLSFYVLLNNEPLQSHLYPFQSIMFTFIQIFKKDFLILLNEGYQDGSPDTAHFGNVTFVVLFVFVLFLPFMLLNLMIGLAVGDISSASRDAEEKRVEYQVQFLAKVDSMLSFLSNIVGEKVFIFTNRLGFVEKYVFTFTSELKDSDPDFKRELQAIEKSIMKVEKVCLEMRAILVAMKQKLGLVKQKE